MHRFDAHTLGGVFPLPLVPFPVDAFSGTFSGPVWPRLPRASAIKKETKNKKHI